MNTTDIFHHPPPSFQFLSICHYLSVLGDLLHDNSDLVHHKKGDYISVLNTLFQHLDQSENEEQEKLELLRKVLKGSDLYGGGENETLDTEYVNATYQNIVSTAVFSHYGYIVGYLAGIINQADDLSYSAFKRRVLDHLSQNYISSRICSSAKVHSSFTSLSVKKIFLDYIWPMFPEPENEAMSIIDADYIHAMVALKISRSALDSTSNLNFRHYKVLSKLTMEMTLRDDTYLQAQHFYQVPALFLYAHQKKEEFKLLDMSSLNKNKRLWYKVFKVLLNHLHQTMQGITQDFLLLQLYEELEIEMKKIRHRTDIALEIIKSVCRGVKLPSAFLEKNVELFKVSQRFLKQLKSFGCKINEISSLRDTFDNQFEKIHKTYYEIQKIIIYNVLERGGLIEILDSNEYYVVGDDEINPLPPKFLKMQEESYLLFMLVKGVHWDFYTVHQKKDKSLELVKLYLPRPLGRVGPPVRFLSDEGFYFNYLKSKEENSTDFILKASEMKTKTFVRQLKRFYYDETKIEKIFNFLKNFVPFFNCIEDIRAKHRFGAAFSCTLDVVSLLPFVGLSSKYVGIFSKSLAFEMRSALQVTSGLSKEGFRVAFTKFVTSAARSIVTKILTKELVKEVALTTVRFLDPGFELLYQGGRFLVNFLRGWFTKIQKLALKLHKGFAETKLILSARKFGSSRAVDHTGMVPVIVGKVGSRDVHRYIYPGGEHYFGPSCIRSNSELAEIRGVVDEDFKIAVTRSKSTGREDSYKAFDFKKEEWSGDVCKMNKRDLMACVTNLARYSITHPNFKPVEVQVHYHTIEWLNTPQKIDSVREQVLSEFLENSNREIYVDVPGSSRDIGSGAESPNERAVSEAESDVPLDLSGFSREVRQRLEKSRAASGLTGGVNESPKRRRIEDDSGIPEKIANVEVRLDDGSNVVLKKIRLSEVAQQAQVPIPKGEEKLHGIFGEAGLKEPETHFYYMQQLGERTEEVVQKFGAKVEKELGLSVELAEARYVNAIEARMSFTEFYTLMAFSRNGALTVRANQEAFRTLQVVLNKLAQQQIGLEWGKNIKRLFYSENSDIVRKLSMLENEFFFPDFTILTSVKPNLHLKNSRVGISGIHTFYDLQVNSGNGIVNLGLVHPSFENEYVVFSCTGFQVLKSKNHVGNSNNFDELQMVQKSITEKEWEHFLRKQEQFFKLQTGLEAVEGASEGVANFVSSVALETVKERMRMQNLFFESNLNDIRDVRTAERRIQRLYGDKQPELIEGAFKNYKMSPIATESIRFEDYYAINLEQLRLGDTLHSADKKIKLAVLRLSLRQSMQHFAKERIFVYSGGKVKNVKFVKYKSLKAGVAFKMEKFSVVSGDIDREIGNAKKMSDSSRKSVLFVIELGDQYGVADIDRVFESGYKLHVMHPQMEFQVAKKPEMINEILEIPLQVKEKPREEKLLDVVKEIERISIE